MAKANKVATASVAAAVASTVVLPANVVAGLENLGRDAADANVASHKASDGLRSRFAALCMEAGVPTIRKGQALVYDRASETGKAVSKILHKAIEDRVKESSFYDIPVYRVGEDDRYLPTRIWSEAVREFVPVKDTPAANHILTAQFALTANLKGLNSVAEKPFGLKAWLVGGANGERPDGRSQGMREGVKNGGVDKVESRLWASDVTKRSAGSNKDFADLMSGLYKAGTKKRGRWSKDNGEDSVVSDDDYKALCALMERAVFDPDFAAEVLSEFPS